jgi:tRNA-dihydrouridine synthase
VAEVKAAVGIPVVVNGDIQTAEDAALALARSGADAVMVGRGHYGRPWAAGEILGKLLGPTDIASYVVEHYEDMLSLYGVQSGLRQARKHLGWYLDRHLSSVSLEVRGAIMTSGEPAVVIQAIRNAFERSSPALERAA